MLQIFGLRDVEQMVRALRITAQQAAELKEIFALGLNVLAKINDELSRESQTIVRSDDLTNIFARHCSRASAATLSSQLLGLATFARNTNQSASHVLESLQAGLKRLNLSEEELSALEAAKSQFTALLANKHIFFSAKALELSVDHENILISTSIVTDSRPIFDEKHQKVVAVIIANDLRLTFGRYDSQEQVYVNLGRKELVALKERCDRALAKIDLLQKHFEDQGISVYVPGIESDNPDESGSKNGNLSS